MAHRMSLPHAVRLFILRTNLMKKAIVQVGYTNFLLDTPKALALLELLAEAELYEEKWRKQEEGGTTYHIYPQDTNEGIRHLKVIPQAFYQMARMAGKPEKAS
jgi:hypothetical protein